MLHIAKALVEGHSAADTLVNSYPGVGCLLAGAQPWLATLGANEGVSLPSQRQLIMKKTLKETLELSPLIMKETLNETLEIRDVEVTN